MEYQYEYRAMPSDLWQIQMYYTYSSYLAIINIIFIVSSVILLFELWATSPWWLRILLILFFSLFTVIQPFSVYIRARKMLKDNHEVLRLTFTDAGIEVSADGQTQFKNWNQLQGVVFKPTLVAIYTDKNHGYILTNRILKDTKKEFRKFVKAKRAPHAGA